MCESAPELTASNCTEGARHGATSERRRNALQPRAVRYTLLGFGLDPPVQFTSCISFAHLNSPQINLINKPRGARAYAGVIIGLNGFSATRTSAGFEIRAEVPYLTSRRECRITYPVDGIC